MLSGMIGTSVHHHILAYKPETELVKDTLGVKVPLEVGMLNEFICLLDS